jgi:hypothetical protein
MVMPRAVKTAAWLLVIFTNFFFVYFAMVRGLERGLQWQRLFLVAAMLQIAIELGLYETSECVIVHYIIPNLARKEVQSALFVLHQAVESICTGAVSNVPLVLDAPRYLFLSTNLAHRFPDLFESVIIKSFHSYSPGELARKWRAGQSASPLTSCADWLLPSGLTSTSAERLRRSASTSLGFSVLQRIGAMPPAAQRLVIHITQPLVLTTIVLIWSYITMYPEFLAIPGVWVLYKVCVAVTEWRADKKEARFGSIHPDLSAPSYSTPDFSARKRSSRRVGQCPAESNSRANGRKSEASIGNTAVAPAPAVPGGGESWKSRGLQGDDVEDVEDGCAGDEDDAWALAGSSEGDSDSTVEAKAALSSAFATAEMDHIAIGLSVGTGRAREVTSAGSAGTSSSLVCTLKAAEREDAGDDVAPGPQRALVGGAARDVCWEGEEDEGEGVGVGESVGRTAYRGMLADLANSEKKESACRPCTAPPHLASQPPVDLELVVDSLVRQTLFESDSDTDVDDNKVIHDFDEVMSRIVAPSSAYTTRPESSMEGRLAMLDDLMRQTFE